MMPTFPVFESLLVGLKHGEFVDLLIQGRLETMRGSRIIEARKQGSRLQLTLAEVQILLPLVLRQVSVDDGTFAGLATEAEIPLMFATGPSNIEVSVPFISAFHAEQLPITELTASCVVIWEISLRVKQVLEEIGVAEPLEPPQVSVRAGSTTFTFGGGTLLVSGIGLVVAAHAALPIGLAADIAFWGGSISSILGVSDFVFGWRKTNAETRNLFAEEEKLRAETHKITAETGKLIAERGKMESETLLNTALLTLRQLEVQKMNQQVVPASALLAPEAIAAEAKRYGLSPALATHLINRIEPALKDANRSFPAAITPLLNTSAKSVSAAG